jgi:hypothetical protein
VYPDDPATRETTTMSDSNSNGRAAAMLPDTIRRYQRAHDDRDTDAALVTFSATAVVTDDGEEARGHEQIRRWLETAASEFTYERTLLEVTSTGPDEWLVTNNLTGNFPGGTVDLAYRSTLHDGLIQQLIIAPSGT